MNNLQLCQKVARESGVISGVAPTSVTGQSGKLLKVVDWTATAWKTIQNHHTEWFFLRASLPSTTARTIAGAIAYTAASWNLDDWGAWVKKPGNISIYSLAVGPADEGEIPFTEWTQFRPRYLRGIQIPGRPVEYSISPAGEFCVGPVPDATYVINGEYQRTAQMLSANGDIPICPDRHHDVIVWKALQMLCEFDEATFGVASSQNRYIGAMGDLERDQLPQISIGSCSLA